MNIYESRWKAALTLAKDIRDKARTIKGGLLMFDGILITPEQLVITDDEIFVKVDNCQFSLFENNRDYDHGLYTSKKDWADKMKRKFTIMQKVSI